MEASISNLMQKSRGAQAGMLYARHAKTWKRLLPGYVRYGELSAERKRGAGSSTSVACVSRRRQETVAGIAGRGRQYVF